MSIGVKLLYKVQVLQSMSNLGQGLFCQMQIVWEEKTEFFWQLALVGFLVPDDSYWLKALKQFNVNTI